MDNTCPKPAGASINVKQRHVAFNASPPKSQAEHREWRRCVIVWEMSMQTVVIAHLYGKPLSISALDRHSPHFSFIEFIKMQSRRCNGSLGEPAAAEHSAS
jgi:hypothetical protein